MSAVNELLRVLNNEVGYLEKKSNSNLDDKTANAGKNNYTKYSRDMAKIGAYSIQGAAWCDCFADWALVQAVGIENAYRLLGGWSAYTPTSASYYKKMGRWYTSNPQVGDQIFFKNSTRICHTGWVVEVSGSTIYTIEGNTSGGSAVIANGGGVFKKKYSTSNSRIAGYGRPDYASVDNSKVTLKDAQETLKKALKIIPSDTTVTLKDAQEMLKKALKINPTTSYTKTEEVKEANKSYLSVGDTGAEVSELQRNLNTVLNAGLAIDGDFGSATKAALKTFQSKYGLTADGLYGKNSRAKMDEVLKSINSKTTSSTPAASTSTGNSVIRDGQIHANNFSGAGLNPDGVRGPATIKGGVKVLQTAMNLDYKAGLVVDGAFGTKSVNALGKHTVRRGETQYMVTALEILLMLKGYNPNGVECPGQFGSGLESTVKRYQSDNGLTADGIAGPATFKSLIS